MEKFRKETKPLKKFEHLKDGIRPIIGCLITPEHFETVEAAKDVFGDPESHKPRQHNVDFYGTPEKLKAQGMKTAGKETYVISPVDDWDKFSHGFADCTGLVVVGVDKITGKNISFMSHQYLDSYVLTAEKNASLKEVQRKASLKEDMRQQLQYLKERSVDKTIDAVIVGGLSVTIKGTVRDVIEEKAYLDSVKFLATEINAALGFEPIVMTGPKTVKGFMNSNRDSIFFDNKNRRLYIMRQGAEDASTESFLPSDIDEQRERWR